MNSEILIYVEPSSLQKQGPSFLKLYANLSRLPAFAEMTDLLIGHQKSDGMKK
jgi:hypothetical protein